jgi:hypothetical protein
VENKDTNLRLMTLRRKGKSTNSAKTISVVQQQEHGDNGCSSDEAGTNHSFFFEVDDVSDSVSYNVCDMLVDCGATTHIVFSRLMMYLTLSVTMCVIC